MSEFVNEICILMRNNIIQTTGNFKRKYRNNIKLRRDIPLSIRTNKIITYNFNNEGVSKLLSDHCVQQIKQIALTGFQKTQY